MLELLSPAGDFECFEAAVMFGADAVYLGSEAFGMRASPKNFNIEGLKKAVDFAHNYNVKVYLTCNIIPTNEEADIFPQFIKEAQTTGIDAVIVTDLGIMEVVKQHAPKLEIHISTQAGITNYAAAKVMYELGAKRVVLAREVDIDNIKRIREEIPSDMEIETFVHGAMCVSFSGRCLLSSYLTGRDANRGECAQPCRWNYYLMEEKRPNQFFKVVEEKEGSYILNAKDLCMLEHIDELSEAGVSSFKIEGRAKSSYYVAVITNAYYFALNAVKNGQPIPEWVKREVFTVSHRQYCTGFYFGHPNACQFYENSGYIREYDFIATVNGFKDGFLEIIQRNYFRLNDEIEALAPKSKPIKINISAMFNEKGENIEIANHAMERLFLKTDIILPKNTILRKPVK